LNEAAVAGQLAALLGDAPRVPLDFAPALDLSTGYGQSLARYLRMAATDLDQPNSVLSNPTMMSMFEQLITTGLLLSHRHNYTKALRSRKASIAPRDVKRAVDYLEARLDAPVMLTDLVAVAGVPGRTLLKHFRDSKGVSPMRYLRNARFQRVRQALMAAQPGESVTTIAMNCGFAHMGRFSVEYRARFGESPSETLRQRRWYSLPLAKS
jgi:AraC-like DNA-binding protein